MRYGVEHFPSLVSAALAVREPNWRAWDAHKAERVGRRGRRRIPSGKVSKVLAMREAGASFKAIAQAVHLSSNTVRDILKGAV